MASVYSKQIIFGLIKKKSNIELNTDNYELSAPIAVNGNGYNTIVILTAKIKGGFYTRQTLKYNRLDINSFGPFEITPNGYEGNVSELLGLINTKYRFGIMVDSPAVYDDTQAELPPVGELIQVNMQLEDIVNEPLPIDYQLGGKFSDIFISNNSYVFTGIARLSLTLPPVVSTPVTWDPLNSALTLSNGNLTTLGTNSQAARATRGVTSGKWYWEVTNNAQLLPGSNPGDGWSGGNPATYGVGFSTSILESVDPGNTFTVLGDTVGSGFGYFSTLGRIAKDGHFNVYETNLNENINGVLGIALDLDNGILSFIVNNQNWGVAVSEITGTIFPMISGSNPYGVVINTSLTNTANFGATPFAYTVPAGYLAYDQSPA